MIRLGRVRLSCVDSGAYACILKRVLSLLAKLQLRNSMMLDPAKHALVIKPAQAVNRSSMPGGAGRKKRHPCFHFSLQVNQGVTVFRRFPLPPLPVMEGFQVNGKIAVKSDDSVTGAKGFRFKINRLNRKLTGSLDIFMPNETEMWIATQFNITVGTSLSQVLDLFKQRMRDPKTVASTLKLTFRDDTLIAEILVESVVDGKHGTLRGIRMVLAPCGVKPFTQ